MYKIWSVLLAACWICSAGAAEKIIELMPPEKTGGKSLMACLSLRQSTKAFQPGRRLSDQQLSNLFYAAGGINRPNGKLTIPTARNLQNQYVYAVLPEGIYKYLPRKHALELVRSGNFMAQTGRQSYHQSASVILIYVSDVKAIGNNVESQLTASGTHAGLAAQNVYLYAASAGLGTVICGNFDGEKLAKLLKLAPGWKVFYIQPAGYKQEK